MQPNEIVLAVNEDNDDGTTAEVNHTYTRYDEYQNRSIYISGTHSPSARNTMAFYRSFPSVNGNFKGVQKSSVKFTEDVVVDGVDGVAQLSAPVILEVNFSYPVGLTASDKVIYRQKLVAALSDDSIMDNLNHTQMI